MKVLLSIDDRLLRRIDQAARKRGLSRSAYLAELAARDVGLATGPGANAEVRRALGRLDRLFSHLDAEDPVAVIRSERDAR